MARLPADEDYARALLSIFKAKKIRARDALPLGETQAAFLDGNMGRRDDFEAALDYAVTRGWLAVDLDRVKLAASGVEEMHSAGGF
jgi:hypothetical protein